MSLAIPFRRLTFGKGVLIPPAGYVFLLDDDGAYLRDEDGAYLMEPV